MLVELHLLWKPSFFILKFTYEPEKDWQVLLVWTGRGRSGFLEGVERREEAETSSYALGREGGVGVFRRSAG